MEWRLHRPFTQIDVEPYKVMIVLPRPTTPYHNRPSHQKECPTTLPDGPGWDDLGSLSGPVPFPWETDVPGAGVRVAVGPLTVGDRGGRDWSRGMKRDSERDEVCVTGGTSSCKDGDLETYTTRRKGFHTGGLQGCGVTGGRRSLRTYSTESLRKVPVGDVLTLERNRWGCTGTKEGVPMNREDKDRPGGSRTLAQTVSLLSLTCLRLIQTLVAVGRQGPYDVGSPVSDRGVGERRRSGYGS